MTPEDEEARARAQEKSDNRMMIIVSVVIVGIIVGGMGLNVLLRSGSTPDEVSSQSAPPSAPVQPALPAQ
jgi:flagellar basal body-associated protein FliL